MSTRATRHRLASLSLGASLACWFLAFLWHFWRPGSFWIFDLVLIPGSVLLYAFGFASVLAVLITTKQWRLFAVLLPVLAAFTLLANPSWRLAPQMWFELHRPFFIAALAVDPGTEYYGNTLPLPLRFLSEGGKVSSHSTYTEMGAPNGARDIRFFPQWVGIPDDAGGFLYSPHRSPASADLYGMECRDPVDLGGGWWMCNMPETGL